MIDRSKIDFWKKSFEEESKKLTNMLHVIGLWEKPRVIHRSPSKIEILIDAIVYIYIYEELEHFSKSIYFWKSKYRDFFTDIDQVD